ncbi:MAG: ATP-binding protein [Bdellovibrionales bacterium]|nr:ATP-binding protein [Bdellovibrionales bacterium]
MQAYLKREPLQKKLKTLIKNYPAVAILGARQVGKSTLAKKILTQFKKSVYLDLQLPRELNKLSDPEAFFDLHKQGLICLDEIQYKTNLFQILRGIIDQRKRNGQFLILGSASRDLIQQSSETLAGRIAFLDITPFDIQEVKEKHFHKHWLRGGYPLSFLSQSDDLSLEWRYNYIRTFLERDIPQLGFNIPSKTLERFWKLLSHSQGQTLNSSKLGEILGKSSHTIKNYIDILEQAFVVRTLKPYIKNIKKRLVKSPKIYIRDTGLLHAHLNIETSDELFGHPIYGSSFESYVIENICHNLKNWNHYFYRTSSGTELDLVLEKAGKLVAIEIKASTSAKPSRGFWNGIEDIKADKKYIIAPIKDTYPIQNNVIVTHLSSFLKEHSMGKSDASKKIV